MVNIKKVKGFDTEILKKALLRQSNTVVPYYTALGEFISRFSEIEFYIQELLWHECGIPEKHAKAIFSGHKVDQSIDAIKRIYSSKKTEIPSLLEKTFNHIGTINGFRNLIVHHGAIFLEDKIIVSNRKVVYKEEKVREIPVSPEILGNMCNDMYTIKMVLSTFADPALFGPDKFKEVCEYLAQIPYSYISPQPKKNNPKPRAKVHRS